VGWVLAGQQGGAQSPPWGLWAVGPPVIAGAFWEPKLPSPLVVLFHTLVTRISLGLWALLAGWSVAGALSDFPWPVALHLVPLIVGLHVPLALTWDRWPSSQCRLLQHLGWLCFCLAALSAPGARAHRRVLSSAVLAADAPVCGGLACDLSDRLFSATIESACDVGSCLSRRCWELS
jgi:hypothetical protein